MNQAISEYLSEVQKELSTGDAKEHSYRPAFKKLTESLVKDIQAINEPAYTGGNAPDFLFKKDGVPIAYAECKDLTVEVTDKATVAQAERYVEAFGKILLTNYLDFRILDENGEVARIVIATKSGSKIEPIQENFDRFENLIKDYITPSERTIRSAKKLAEIMAGKGRLLRDNSLAALKENKESDIYSQYRAFKEVLIRDLSEEEFADMYAQTLVYGLFVARYFDTTLKDFSRHEAQDLLPSTNPLLKKFFGHVAGTEFDEKVAWMVDSLIEAYKSTDVRELMHKEFEKKHKDPVLHFYETFLTEYDKDLRKSRGVYYTPEPVVSFIIRSVDSLLKNKFDLSEGLSDTSKIEHEFTVQGTDGRRKDGSKKIKEQIHKVQILDPAVGTGTFLNEIILEIYKKFDGQEGRWNGYVKEELLSRLHGFELMMASYTMAHLKLGVTLKELGYEGNSERLSVWLTNSLEESVHEVPNLFMSQWLTQESNEAAKIKSEMPIMVVTGNPPYAVSSKNPSRDEEGNLTYIGTLLEDYKKDLNERKITLDDDYIKFIRYAEEAVLKTGYGIVAMITNNSFVEGVTHRQMRKHLLETFDEIYIMNLHGSAAAQDDGSNIKDENVFDIQQGVSINLFIKKTNENGLGKVFYSELKGDRKSKFDSLNNLNVDTTSWQELSYSEPYYFFNPKNFDGKEEYENGFAVDELFLSNNTGIQTKKDDFTISFDQETIKNRVRDLTDLTIPELEEKYGINDKGVWKASVAKADILKGDYVFSSILYRPFDTRYTAYTERSSGFLARPRHSVSKDFINKENLGLVTLRLNGENEQYVCLVTNSITEKGSLPRGNYSVFPLYTFMEDGTKEPNLNSEIWQKISTLVGDTKPEDLLDYIYAILNSAKYRAKYREFLKISFPRIPFPETKDVFWKLVEIGRKLRHVHLLTNQSVTGSETTFPESGDNVVEKKFPQFKEERVYINSKQYFGNVPKEAWELYVGGYQPAQKWLKDRKARKLSDSDIKHYQKIVAALNETIDITGEIDNLLQV